MQHGAEHRENRQRALDELGRPAREDHQRSGLGLSAEAAYRVLAATPLAAQAERRRAAIEAGEFPPRFPLTLAGKDAQLIADAAAAAGVELRLITAAATWLAEAQQAGLGGRDYTAMLKTILRASGSGQYRTL